MLRGRQSNVAAAIPVLYSMVLQGNAWYCMILYGIDLYYIVSNFVYVSA